MERTKRMRNKSPLVTVILAVIILSALSPCAEKVCAKSSTDTSACWDACDDYKKCARFSVDTEQKYGTSAYSFRLENTGYDYSSARKKVVLKPNTGYRFSAMVKYEGYELEPGASGDSGASVGVVVGDSGLNPSGKTKSSEWTRVERTFTTDETGKADLYLRNGYPYCKGTAYFSNIRIEEILTTDKWNILVILVKTIDSDIMVDKKVSHYKSSFSKKDLTFLKKNLGAQLKKQLPRVSDGLIGVGDVDLYVMKEPLKKLLFDDNEIRCNRLDPNEETFAAEVDKRLEKKSYQQIIAVLPFEYGKTKWGGLGGTKYKGINFCQFVHYPGMEVFTSVKSYADYPISGYIHEILHGVEYDSKAIDGDKTPDFHENVGIYSDYYDDKIDGWFSYHHDYITGNLPDGRGINKSVLKRQRGFLLVSDEMGAGSGFGSDTVLPKHISEAVKSIKVAGAVYKGKAVKPKVTVRGAKKGTDYKLSYQNNKAPGKGKVIITGNGDYYGSVEREFKISKSK